MRIALLAASFLLVATSLTGEIIDRIAATVDRDVITLSEVRQVIEIRLIPRNSGENEEEYHRRVLDTMIAQALRYRDVLRFGAEDVSQDTIEAKLAEVQARFPSTEAFYEALQRAELTLDELRALIKRQLQVNAYIDERFSPLVFVSLEEIETYYQETWTPQRRQQGLPVLPLSEVREDIRNILKAERLDLEIQKWTSQLRAAANVDVYVYR